MRIARLFPAVFFLLIIACNGTRKPVEKPYLEITLESINGNDTAVLRQTIDRLTDRLDESGLSLDDFSFTSDSGRITGRFALDAIADKSRLRKLLQTDANLLFCETFLLEEIVAAFQNADNFLKQPDPADTVLSEGPPKTGLFDVLKVNLPDPSQMQHGATAYMLKTPLVGVAQLRDTSAVNRMLNDKTVLSFFPANIAFHWTAYAISEGNQEQLYGLVAIKTGTASTFDPGQLEDVSIQSNDGSVEKNLEIIMSPEKSAQWARMTKANINRAIAIEMDGRVFSYPTVQGEITGGKTWISGTGQTDLDDLKAIMKAGSLPAAVRIVEEKVVR